MRVLLGDSKQGIPRFFLPQSMAELVQIYFLDGMDEQRKFIISL